MKTAFGVQPPFGVTPPCGNDSENVANGRITQSCAREIAESIVGKVRWHGAEGVCRCPGDAKHSKPGDAKVVAEPLSKAGRILPPGVYCFHESCREDVKDASYRLRRALWDRSPCKDGLPDRPLATLKPEARFEPTILARIARKLDGIDASWFAARSPIRPDTRTPASFLHCLYEVDEKIVVFDRFKSQGQALWTCNPSPFDAAELNGFQFGKRCGVWFLINPVDGLFHSYEDGKKSRRKWKSITSWRYLLLESDNAEPGEWLAVLAQMPLRIAAISTSGGRSSHALVRMDAVSKANWDAKCGRMESTLITLGADRKALKAVQLSRLPCCMRLGKEKKDGSYVRFSEPALQALLYINPKPAAIPICDLPVVHDTEAASRRWGQLGEAFL